jgi:hypothetical protein
MNETKERRPSLTAESLHHRRRAGRKTNLGDDAEMSTSILSHESRFVRHFMQPELFERKCWDAFMIALIALDALVTPFLGAYQNNADIEFGWLLALYAVDILRVMDMYAQTYTIQHDLLLGIVDEHKELRRRCEFIITFFVVVVFACTIR